MIRLLGPLLLQQEVDFPYLFSIDYERQLSSIVGSTQVTFPSTEVNDHSLGDSGGSFRHCAGNGHSVTQASFCSSRESCTIALNE